MAFNPLDILTGNVAAGDQNKNAQKYLDQEAGAFNGITAPTLSPVTLQQQQWQQDVSPALMNQGADVGYTPAQAAQALAAMQGPSAMGGVTVDPALEADQMSSIAALQQLANNGGMNLQDKANLQNIEGQVDQQDKARQAAIMQNMAERGESGSGQELLQRLTSAQNATNAANQQSLDVGAQAQQRALQAMLQGGQLAGQVRGEQFNEQAQKAQAQDAINRFNAQNATQASEYNTGATNAMNQFNAANNLSNAQRNRATDLGVQQYNTGAVNQGQYYNNQGRQGVSNANTGIGNQQNYYNSNTVPNENFNNQMTLARGKGGAAQAGVDYWGKQAAANRQGFGNFMSGAASIGAAALSGKGGNSNSGSNTSSSQDYSGDASGGDGNGDVNGDAGSYSDFGDGGYQATAYGGMIQPAYANGGTVQDDSIIDVADGGLGRHVPAKNAIPLSRYLPHSGDLSLDTVYAPWRSWDGGELYTDSSKYAHGGLVPGHARVPGDSLANDTVPVRLSPGELVVDRNSLANAPKAAKPFLNKVAGHKPLHMPAIAPDRLGDFLKGLNPPASPSPNLSLSNGLTSDESGSAQPNLDDTIAKLSALGLLSKQGS